MPGRPVAKPDWRLHPGEVFLKKSTLRAAIVDHRKDPNGSQVDWVVALVMRNKPSVDFCGYSQRGQRASPPICSRIWPPHMAHIVELTSSRIGTTSDSRTLCGQILGRHVMEEKAIRIRFAKHDDTVLLAATSEDLDGPVVFGKTVEEIERKCDGHQGASRGLS